jgi:hypothetical protein
MIPVLHPQLKAGHTVRRAALVFALTLMGVLCGSVIHGIKTLVIQ